MPRIPLAEVLPAELTAYATPKWPEIIAACARIESARNGAQEEFLEAIRQARQQNLQFDLERQAFCTYVLTVRLAVNHELCLLARQPARRRKSQQPLPVYRVRDLLERFLENFTIFVAYPEDGRDRHGRPIEHVIEHRLGHSPSLSPSFRELVEQHKLWAEGQAELKAAADHQDGKQGKKPRKKNKPQYAVIVDPARLMEELKALNAKRKESEKLELNDLNKLAAQLAAESQGIPNKKSWLKLLTGTPVRSDVPDHAKQFFEEQGHHLKRGIQYLENSRPKT